MQDSCCTAYGIYMHILCMVINNKRQLCCFETAQSSRLHIVLVCTQSSTNVQYLEVQQGEGRDFSPSLLSYTSFSFLSIFSAGKSAEVIGCLCLGFSGALNAR